MPLPILAIVGATFVIGGFAQSAMHLYPPLWNAWQKFAFRHMPNVNPQIAELIEMSYRGLIDEGEYLKRCSEFGLNEQIASKLFEAAGTLLNIQDYITLWRRGEIDENECNNLLYQNHLSEREVKLAKAVTLFFPSAPDLVRFAVREVYTPQIVEAFGMMQDLPEQYIKEAKRSGLTDEHAKQFWAAHWELPSAQMGFQMFHRRIITEDQLKQLLRALDVMPFWRDALIKLSYNPLTRVDVRRMYGLGVLDESEVYDAYLDRGYSPENADRMTEFTIAFQSDELTGITRASVMSSYQKGIITKEQLKKYLEGFGYAAGVVDFWLSMADYDKEMQSIDLITDEIKARYFAGMISIEQARAELDRRDLPASYVAEVITDLTVRASAKQKIPSKADLENWLKLQLIGEQEYYMRMTQLGYTREDIEMYLSEVAKEQDTVKPKYLSQKTYERWVLSDIMDISRFKTIMRDQGVREADIQNLERELMQAKEAAGEGEA